MTAENREDQPRSLRDLASDGEVVRAVLHLDAPPGRRVPDPRRGQAPAATTITDAAVEAVSGLERYGV